jgi:hypothetical protein
MSLPVLHRILSLEVSGHHDTGQFRRCVCSEKFPAKPMTLVMQIPLNTSDCDDISPNRSCGRSSGRTSGGRSDENGHSSSRGISGRSEESRRRGSPIDRLQSIVPIVRDYLIEDFLDVNFQRACDNVVNKDSLQIQVYLGGQLTPALRANCLSPLVRRLF